MARCMVARLGLLTLVAALAGWLATPALALAGWTLNSTSTTSVAYNQGIAFDQALGNFFFDGVSSTSNSALYRTNSRLSQTASNPAVIPTDPQLNPQGYNHAGDLSFDATNVSITATGTPRVLLPLECYYPSATPSNTCGSGAFGVVDPTTLSFLYYVRLWTPQIQKAMWDEITPDGHWIFTSSGTHLLAYNAADINKQRADNQLHGVWGGLGGTDLGAVLPTSDVSGGAFHVVSGVPRLFVALNQGTYFEVVSYGIGTASDGTPTLLSSTPTTEITVTKSSSNNEPEGLAITGLFNGAYPLGGLLHWQMLPSLKIYSRILNYTPNAGASTVSGASAVSHASTVSRASAVSHASTVSRASAVSHASTVSRASAVSHGASSRAAACVVPKLKHHALKRAKKRLTAAQCGLAKLTPTRTARSRRGKVIAQHSCPRPRKESAGPGASRCRS